MDCDHQVSDTSTTVSHSEARGRPSFAIKEEHLAFLVENDFKVPEISSMLGLDANGRNN